MYDDVDDTKTYASVRIQGQPSSKKQQMGNGLGGSSSIRPAEGKATLLPPDGEEEDWAGAESVPSFAPASSGEGLELVGGDVVGDFDREGDEAAGGGRAAAASSKYSAPMKKRSGGGFLCSPPMKKRRKDSDGSHLPDGRSTLPPMADDEDMLAEDGLDDLLADDEDIGKKAKKKGGKGGGR